MLVNQVAWTLLLMPLPRLQFIGREEDRFLYEYNFTTGSPRPPAGPLLLLQHVGALAEIAREHRWESRPEQTLSVARAIYGMLPDDARLWRHGRDFVSIERQIIRSALAA